MIRAALTALVACLLSGCASLFYAGESDYHIALPNGVDITIHSGKQQQTVEATFSQTATGFDITLKETGVQAFQGQQIVGNATSDSVGQATSAVITGLKLIK